MELSKNDSFSIEGSHRRRSGSRPPKIYRVFEGLSEGLIYLMVVLSPWLFGTTDPWAVWIMNGVAYALGGLLAAKWWFRWKTGFNPPRWDDLAEGMEEADRRRRIRNGLTRALGWLTIAILAYVLISGLNARANFYLNEQRFEYYDCFNWLPHSYNRGATMFVFWIYLGLTFFFWATRDWLLGKTPREMKGRSELIIPDRLRRLLWVICVNGGILALEALLQRLSGTDKVLWLIKPRWNNWSELQYGPYPYRSNAAQYFNLIWPMCLGFWWLLQGEKRRDPNHSGFGTGPDLLLLPMIVLMAASPIISTSRGGSIVAIIEIILGSIILLRASRNNARSQVVTTIIFASVLGLAAFFGWSSLAPRLKHISDDDLGGRTEIYENARRMKKDFGVFGSGPGSFAALYQLYRSKQSDDWAAYVHDDWLETHITFGGLGCAALAGIMGILLIKALITISQKGGRPLTGLGLMSISGVCLHAKFDFPLQVYSILLGVILGFVLLECSPSLFVKIAPQVK